MPKPATTNVALSLVRVLEVVARQSEGASVLCIERETGIQRRSVERIVNALASVHLVESAHPAHHPAQVYRIGGWLR